jgi:hypothetical protein
MKIRLLAFILVCCTTSFAQTKEAQKFDEFRNPQCEDYLARMDGFVNELHKFPSAKGYVLVYEGRLIQYYENKARLVLPHIGEAESYIRSMKRCLALRAYPEKGFVFVNAGFREKLAIEFWLVPNGAMPPTRSGTIRKIKHRRGKPVDFCGWRS